MGIFRGLNLKKQVEFRSADMLNHEYECCFQLTNHGLLTNFQEFMPSYRKNRIIRNGWVTKDIRLC